jgi:delta-aminolevulinic acid dehydratase/porphobilinogen synthase
MPEYCEICSLCSCIVSIERGTVLRTDTTIAKDFYTCEYSKNGYCGVFRAQAVIDQEALGMHKPKNPHFEEIRGKF